MREIDKDKPNKRTVHAYDDELHYIESKLREMKDMVTSQLNKLESVVIDGNTPVTKQIIDNDMAINDLEGVIRMLVAKIIVRRQPVGIDLLRVLNALYIAADFERMGDHIRNMARNLEFIDNLKSNPVVYDCITKSLEIAKSMLTRMLFSYNTSQITSLQAIIEQDSGIDSCYEKLFNELMKNTIPRDVAICNIARSIERIGDHVVYVVNHILRVITGV